MATRQRVVRVFGSRSRIVDEEDVPPAVREHLRREAEKNPDGPNPTATTYAAGRAQRSSLSDEEQKMWDRGVPPAGGNVAADHMSAKEAMSTFTDEEVHPNPEHVRYMNVFQRNRSFEDILASSPGVEDEAEGQEGDGVRRFPLTEEYYRKSFEGIADTVGKMTPDELGIPDPTDQGHAYFHPDPYEGYYRNPAQFWDVVRDVLRKSPDTQALADYEYDELPSHVLDSLTSLIEELLQWDEVEQPVDIMNRSQYAKGYSGTYTLPDIDDYNARSEREAAEQGHSIAAELARQDHFSQLEKSQMIARERRFKNKTDPIMDTQDAFWKALNDKADAHTAATEAALDRQESAEKERTARATDPERVDAWRKILFGDNSDAAMEHRLDIYLDLYTRMSKSNDGIFSSQDKELLQKQYVAEVAKLDDPSFEREEHVMNTSEDSDDDTTPEEEEYMRQLLKEAEEKGSAWLLKQLHPEARQEIESNERYMKLLRDAEEPFEEGSALLRAVTKYSGLVWKNADNIDRSKLERYNVQNEIVQQALDNFVDFIDNAVNTLAYKDVSILLESEFGDEPLSRSHSLKQGNGSREMDDLAHGHLEPTAVRSEFKSEEEERMFEDHGIRMNETQTARHTKSTPEVLPEDVRLIRGHAGPDYSEIAPFFTEVRPKDKSVDEPWESLQKQVLRQKGCPICYRNSCKPFLPIDYTNIRLLNEFIDLDGSLKPKRETGVCAKRQRQIARSVKTARMMGLLPYFNKWSFEPFHPIAASSIQSMKEDPDEMARVYDWMVDGVPAENEHLFANTSLDMSSPITDEDSYDSPVDLDGNEAHVANEGLHNFNPKDGTLDLDRDAE